jgi:hypothetical protein
MAWWPPLWNQIGVTVSTVYQMNATTEHAGIVFRAPKTGTIDEIAAHLTVANAFDNGLRVSFQAINATGFNDGTPVENAVLASGSQATGWNSFGALSAGKSVTRGAVYCLVFDNVSFTAGDDVSIGSTSFLSSGEGFPYGILNAAKVNASLPNCALHYSDGTWALPSPTIWTLTVGGTNFNIDNATTPDEVGMAFQLPFPCRLTEALFPLQVAATGDFDVILYDASNTVLSTVSYDGNVTNSTSGRWYHCLLASAVDLAANTLYRIVYRPSTTNNVIIEYATMPNSGLFAANVWGGYGYATVRTDAGSWTNYNNGTDGYRIVAIALGLKGLNA